MTTKAPAYQVRIFLKQEFANAVAAGKTPKGLKPLMDILAKHGAIIDHNQLEEFETFIKDAEAGRPTRIPEAQVQGVLALTKASVANPLKRSYFAREFTLSVGGKDLFTGTEANALIADLKTLDGSPLLKKGKAFAYGQSKVVEPVRKTYKPKQHPGTKPAA